MGGGGGGLGVKRHSYHCAPIGYYCRRVDGAPGELDYRVDYAPTWKLITPLLDCWLCFCRSVDCASGGVLMLPRRTVVYAPTWGIVDYAPVWGLNILLQEGWLCSRRRGGYAHVGWLMVPLADRSPFCAPACRLMETLESSWLSSCRRVVCAHIEGGW